MELETVCTKVDVAGALVEMVAAFLIRFDAPNTAESHQVKADAAKAKIMRQQPVKTWPGPFRVQTPAAVSGPGGSDA
jgi:hypothetical protein